MALDLDSEKFQSREKLNAVQPPNFRSVRRHTAHGTCYIPYSGDDFRMVLIFVYFVCSIPYTKIKTAKI